MRMNQAKHDPDFDLAEGTHQMALTLRIYSNDLERNHIYDTSSI